MQPNLSILSTKCWRTTRASEIIWQAAKNKRVWGNFCKDGRKLERGFTKDHADNEKAVNKK